MKRSTLSSAAITALLLLGRTQAAVAADVKYNFTAGELTMYETTVKTEYPAQIKTQVGYLILRPESVEADGKIKLSYRWGIKVLRTQSAHQTYNEGFGRLSEIFDDNANRASTAITIDSRGTVVDNEGELNGAQLSGAQGSAWRLMLQPLPPDGQTTWEVKTPITLFAPQKGPGGFPIANANPASEVPGESTTTYTAAAPVTDTMTVQRKYDLTAGKPGDPPVEHMHGEGQYVFDTKIGHVRTLHWALTDDINFNGSTISVPITVDARLMPADEVAKVKADLIARDATLIKKQAEDDQKKNADEAMYNGGEMVDNIGRLPPGMQPTDIIGGSGGGEFATVSADRKPVIGFRVEVGDWMGKSCIRNFKPIYVRPKTLPPSDKQVSYQIARDGYAVGSITCNGDKDGLHALCITFMKMADKGVDPKQAYVSPWFGQKVGTSQKRLTGNGKLVYGTCGHHGLNLDAIGLVIEAPPADDSDKP